ncbi:MAG: hypothetical protein JW837_08105 [Sedimentisphaerales bacterium]|nr:hypothetical protein [Sedimentisphaerales bacterium]
MEMVYIVRELIFLYNLGKTGHFIHKIHKVLTDVIGDEKSYKKYNKEFSIITIILLIMSNDGQKGTDYMGNRVHYHFRPSPDKILITSRGNITTNALHFKETTSEPVGGF